MRDAGSSYLGHAIAGLALAAANQSPVAASSGYSGRPVRVAVSLAVAPGRERVAMSRLASIFRVAVRQIGETIGAVARRWRRRFKVESATTIDCSVDCRTISDRRIRKRNPNEHPSAP